MRLLFWLALLVLIVMAIRKKMQPVVRAQQEPAVDQHVPAAGDEAENMVCCAHCQMYLPASDAVYRGQQAYCSSAHAEFH